MQPVPDAGVRTSQRTGGGRTDAAASGADVLISLHSALTQSAVPSSYQDLIRRFFPGVVLRPAEDLDPSLSTEVFDACWVPDDRLEDFEEFLAQRFGALVLAEGLEVPAVVPHTVSDTLRRFPGLARGAPP
jgi:hypothetical protein